MKRKVKDRAVKELNPRELVGREMAQCFKVPIDLTLAINPLEMHLSKGGVRRKCPHDYVK